MPAVSHAKTPCILQLASELGFASKPTLLRHLERIDELGPQVDPDGVYPEDWIIFRITGYRPEIESPALIPGEALRGDLSAIAERISEYASLKEDDLDGSYETIDSLCQRWSVSRKTIERYRRRGLIARRIDLGGGHRSVVFMRSSVEWFESLNSDRIGQAGRFDRIGESRLEQFERWASGYQRRLGWSRSQSSARIAERSGHSHEGIRRALIRIDERRIVRQESPIFDERPVTSDREQVFAMRAIGRGIEPKAIADRLGRSHNTVLRAINAARVTMLGSYGLPPREKRSDDFEEQLEEVLGSSAVCQGLNTRGETDLCGLIATTRDRRASVVYEETMRASGYRLLMMWCADRYADLDQTTASGTALDEIETDLRFAGMLKVELVRSQMNLILSTIEHKIDGAVDTLDPSRAAFLLLGGIRVVCGVIDRFDPLGQRTNQARLAAPCGLAIMRFVSGQPDVAQPMRAGRAMRRIAPGHMVIDWTRLVNPWDRWLMCDRRIVKMLDEMSDQLGDRDRLILTRRFGLDGVRPSSRLELCGLLGVSAMHCARYERGAVRNGMNLVRKNRS